MRIRSGWLMICLLAVVSSSYAMQNSELAGTWVGKVKGFDVEMSFVLRADGSAEYEGAIGRWRVQGNRLLLTQEGETVSYNFKLEGSRLTLSGGDLMAPMVMTRVGGGGSMPMPTQVRPDSQESEEPLPTPGRVPKDTSERKQPVASSTSSKKALSEAEISKLLEGGVASRRIIDLVEERGIAFPVNSATVSRLKAKGATNALIGALQQASDRTEPEPASVPARQDPLADAIAGGRTPSSGQRMATSRGPRFDYDKWGISFAMPPGWKAGERQGLLLLGSDTEAGLIIIRLARKTTLEQLIRDYGEGMQDEGIQLMPTMQAHAFPAGQNRAAAGELAGVAQDGARIRARTVAVASPFGDAVVVLGMTTEEKYAGLKPRVDSIAGSFQFTQPQAPPVVEAIAGQWYYFSSSSFGSSERYLNLCSDGRFSENSSIYSSGSAGTGYGEGGQTAQWTGDGDEGQGTVTVTHPNGETSQFQYQLNRGDLMVGGRRYARYGDGSCTKTSAY